MCELLGFTSEKNMDISDYLRSFFAHSRNNPHGWGMMYENSGRVILKEPVSANESCFLGDMIDSISPQRALLAHDSTSVSTLNPHSSIICGKI